VRPIPGTVVCVLRSTRITTGLLLALGLTVIGCGGGDDKATSAQTPPATTAPATTAPATTAPDAGQGTTDSQPKAAKRSGSSEPGSLPGTYTYSGATKGALKIPVSAEGQLALARRAKKAPKSASAGCRLYALGKRRQWGPAPPAISARLPADDDVIVRWRFKEFPDSLGCKPALVVIGISKGKPGSQGFTSLVFKYRVRSLRGESRQRTIPYLTKPPYKVTVAGESIAKIQGPPVNVRVNR
jgi:hypothetical protein